MSQSPTSEPATEPNPSSTHADACGVQSAHAYSRGITLGAVAVMGATLLAPSLMVAKVASCVMMGACVWFGKNLYRKTNLQGDTATAGVEATENPGDSESNASEEAQIASESVEVSTAGELSIDAEEKSDESPDVEAIDGASKGETPVTSEMTSQEDSASVDSPGWIELAAKESVSRQDAGHSDFGSSLEEQTPVVGKAEEVSEEGHELFCAAVQQEGFHSGEGRSDLAGDSEVSQVGTLSPVDANVDADRIDDPSQASEEIASHVPESPEVETPEVPIEQGTQENPVEVAEVVEVEDPGPNWGEVLWQHTQLPMCLLDTDGNMLVQNQACEDSLRSETVVDSARDASEAFSVASAAEATDNVAAELQNAWHRLIPDPEVRARMFTSMCQQSTPHQEVVETEVGCMQVHLTQVHDELGQFAGFALSWMRAETLPDPEPLPIEEMQTLAERAEDLVQSQEQWLKQTEQTKELLEKAWTGWEEEPMDRKKWAEGGTEWQSLASECQTLSKSLGEWVSQGLQSVQDMQRHLGQCVDAGTGLGAIVPSLIEFADQANLMAFNATIEAAGAGEAGRGFARVATDIRDLAHDGGRRGQEAFAENQRLQQTSEEMGHVSERLVELIQKMETATTTLVEDLESQETQVQDIVRAGCKQGDSAHAMARTLQVVVEANRVQSAMAKNLGQTVVTIEQSMQSLTQRLMEIERGDEQGKAKLRIVA